MRKRVTQLLFYIVVFSHFTPVDASSLLCELAGRSLSSENSLKVQEQLVNAGFLPLEQSGYYLFENAIVQVTVEGKVRLFFEQFYRPENWLDRSTWPFSLHSAEKGVIAILPGRRPNKRPDVIDTGDGDRRALNTRAARKPMRKQLKAAGFVESSEVRGMHTFNGEPSEGFIAFTEDGRMKRLYQEIWDYGAKILPERFNVVGREKKFFDNGNFNGPYTEITIEDGNRKYVLSTHGDRTDQGRIVKEELLGSPIEDYGTTIQWPEPSTEPNSNFVIGGKNQTAEIDRLGTLNGKKIGEIEGDMRPGESSMAGFLGPGESLVEILKQDNQFVTNQLGLTHQKIAEPMRIAEELWLRSNRGVITFTYRGRRYSVNGTSWAGTQSSPFGDGTRTFIDIKVTNLDSGASISYSGLVPDMIWRYGFYEGNETPYRVNPKDIVKVFDFLEAS